MRALCSRGRERGTDLVQHFVFADDGALDTGRNAQEVLDGLGAFKQCRAGYDRWRLGVDPEELYPVAGLKEDAAR